MIWMPLLTADDIGERHRYLAETRPDWERSMSGIKNRGGPWECSHCDGVSYVVYRCSICGGDLVGGGTS